MRSKMLGKVLVPEFVRQGAEWRKVIGADINIQFARTVQAITGNPDGRLDEIINDLAINEEQASAWYPKVAAPREGTIYNPFAQSSNWARIAIKARGIYKLNRTDLSTAGVNVAAIDPRTLRLFHGSGKTLPTANSVQRDSLAEMAIVVQGEEDGVFGGDDFIMFYANGPDFWDWSDTLQYRLNPYGDRNVFYLTYGGSFSGSPKRMTLVDGTTPTADTIKTFVDPLHFEEEKVLSSRGGTIDDYFHWYWSDNPSVDIFLNLPAPLNGATHSLRVKAYADSVSLRLNNLDIDADSVRTPFFYFHSAYFDSALNQLGLQLTASPYGTLTDFLELNLERALRLPTSGELFFSGDSTGSAHSYRIENAPTNTFVLDVTRIRDQRWISAAYVSGDAVFSATPDSDEGRVFAVASEAGTRKPFSIVPTQIDDIRSESNAADLVIITHDNFYSQALDFAGYRNSHDGMRVRVVRISDVYAQFSGGMADPVAIRDFLKFAYEHWSGAKPSFCLLVGDGVYDFRNNQGTGGVNYVPPYIVANDSTISDENFVYFGDPYELDPNGSYPADRGVDMVISRWPVKTTAEFLTVAQKMKNYDAAGNNGPWRNLITLIADDQNHAGQSSEMQHTVDSENLADGSIPPKFDLNKIYGVDYPYVGSEKPAAREAIIRSVNNGTLLVNFVGHGSPNLWADERMFRRIQDIPRLQNSDRLPLIFNASCSIGFFDDPLSEGMGEEFLRYPAGGAVGTVSATRLVYSRPNFLFNQAAFGQLFSDKDYTIAEAVFVAKLLRQGSWDARDNDRKYIYLGDPLTRLGVAADKINFVTLQPDSLVALTVTELAGQVEDQDGVLQSDFSGNMSVSVFDNERTRDFPSLHVSYKQYGQEIYRGKVDVTNGHFNLKFVVPKDISYGGRRARISSYALSSTSGASGYLFPIAIGSMNKDVTDTTGPNLAVYFADDPAKGDGAQVSQNARVTMELFDSLGINLSGDIGHAIEVVIDDSPEMTFALTDSFAYDAGSYQRGKATMTLPQLTPGEHRLRVKAWDSANNSSQKELAFRVSSTSGLEITQLLCYPNPVADKCQFAYILTEEATDVSLKIFTVSGLEIMSIDDLPHSSGYHDDVRWDVRDADGDLIANGVYIFQLSAQPANSTDSKRVASASKLVVMK
ncbi:MAG: type IX secretion system sortase PorU [Candidatus Zixiibacteriota bacterium]|nr:MAG: type IX secretion system sortase PorU [candidate division Zixibacteria bacterium]